MSGAGRGSPRISPLAAAIPSLLNFSSNAPRTNSIIDLGDGRWCFTLNVNDASGQTLTGTFADYNDGVSAVFNFPQGGIRGMLEIAYTPAAADSQLEIALFYPGIITTASRGIFSLGNTPTFPNAADSLGATVPIGLPVYQTQAEGTTSLYRFGLPFCLPAGCPTSMSMQIREAGTNGGTFDLERLLIENFGC